MFGAVGQPVSLYEARFLSSTNILSAQDRKSLVLMLEDLFFPIGVSDANCLQFLSIL